MFGLSAGAIEAALNAYAVHHFGPRRINLMHPAHGVGAVTSPLIVTAVINAGNSWRWAYLTVMVSQVLLTVSFSLLAAMDRCRSGLINPAGTPPQLMGRESGLGGKESGPRKPVLGR